MTLQTAPAEWPLILASIRKRVSEQQFATWFQNLKAVSVSPEHLHLRVPNRFFRDWLTHNYTRILEDAAAETIGGRPTITFAVDEVARTTPREEQQDTLVVPQPFAAPQGIQLNDLYSFDTFVVGPDNHLAHAAAIAVSDSPGKTYNPLFIYGSVGLGKSHLLQAVCHACLAKRRTQRLAYLSCEMFVNEFISAIQRNNLAVFRSRYRQMDLLLIDDIQFLSRAERSQEEFFHTFNDLYNAQKQVVISSDQPPQEITGLQERLTSRFKSGLVARIDAPSYEMRVAILHKKADLRAVSIPEDVMEYIASTITSNIRELDGAITKVAGYASLLQQPISLEVARTALHEPSSVRGLVTIEDILSAVTSHFGVRVADLQSKKRSRSIVLPRQICMYLARSLTVLSLEEIGGYFGGRDHTTVLYAEDKISTALSHDPSLARTIETLKRNISATPSSRRSLGRG